MTDNVDTAVHVMDTEDVAEDTHVSIDRLHKLLTHKDVSASYSPVTGHVMIDIRDPLPGEAPEISAGKLKKMAKSGLNKRFGGDVRVVYTDENFVELAVSAKRVHEIASLEGIKSTADILNEKLSAPNLNLHEAVQSNRFTIEFRPARGGLKDGNLKQQQLAIRDALMQHFGEDHMRITKNQRNLLEFKLTPDVSKTFREEFASKGVELC